MSIQAYADKLQADDPNLSAAQALKLATSIVHGTSYAAAYAINPMLEADCFIRRMQDAVLENEWLNMGNRDNTCIIAGWRDAQAIIDIYDEELLTDDEGDVVDGFAALSATEQAYVLATLDAWLQSKKPVNDDDAMFDPDNPGDSE